MYLDYWKLNKNPFDNVPDPGMYFAEHSTVEGTVAELLFAIEEANECLAVVVGEVGLGKTMSLRVVLNELDPGRYRVAYITNPDVTFNQLLREIIGQLQGKKCELRNKEDLLEEFNLLLFKTADAGLRLLIFIDEGNALRPANLEGLRLLTNMQEDERNLFTLILAGQPKLAKMLRDPRRENIFQRIGVYCSLEPMDSAETVEAYIRHRLVVAGGTSPVFDHSGFEAIFERSGGIPRLVNRICKLCMKAAETNQLELISGEIVHQIADRFARVEKGGKATAKAFERQEKQGSPKQVESRGELHEFPAPGRQAVDETPETGEAEDISGAYRDAVAVLGGGSGGQRPCQQEPARKDGSPGQMRPEKKKIQLMGVTPKSIVHLKDMSSPRDKLRYAGLLAARELKINPERFEGIDSDPVKIWDDLRRAIIEAV